MSGENLDKAAGLSRSSGLCNHFATTRIAGQSGTISQDIFAKLILKRHHQVTRGQRSNASTPLDDTSLFSFLDQFSYQSPKRKNGAPKSRKLDLSDAQHAAMYALSGCNDVASTMSRVKQGVRAMLTNVFGIDKHDFMTWFKNRRLVAKTPGAGSRYQPNNPLPQPLPVVPSGPPHPYTVTQVTHAQDPLNSQRSSHSPSSALKRPSGIGSKCPLDNLALLPFPHPPSQQGPKCTSSFMQKRGLVASLCTNYPSLPHLAPHSVTPMTSPLSIRSSGVNIKGHVLSPSTVPYATNIKPSGAPSSLNPKPSSPHSALSSQQAWTDCFHTPTTGMYTASEDTAMPATLSQRVLSSTSLSGSCDSARSRVLLPHPRSSLRLDLEDDVPAEIVNCMNLLDPLPSLDLSFQLDQNQPQPTTHGAKDQGVHRVSGVSTYGDSCYPAPQEVMFDTGLKRMSAAGDSMDPFLPCPKRSRSQCQSEEYELEGQESAPLSCLLNALQHQSSGAVGSGIEREHQGPVNCEHKSVEGRHTVTSLDVQCFGSFSGGEAPGSAICDISAAADVYPNTSRSFSLELLLESLETPGTILCTDGSVATQHPLTSFRTPPQSIMSPPLSSTVTTGAAGIGVAKEHESDHLMISSTLQDRRAMPPLSNTAGLPPTSAYPLASDCTWSADKMVVSHPSFVSMSQPVLAVGIPARAAGMWPLDDHSYYTKQLQSYLGAAAVSNRQEKPSGSHHGTSMMLSCMQTLEGAGEAFSVGQYADNGVTSMPAEQYGSFTKRCSSKLDDDDGFFSEWCNIIMASSSVPYESTGLIAAGCKAGM
ncbi:hypothetical protein CEUSTIGMA_g6948.t1 [Chlamydomonas eustigma]|uniref:Uncharacterized protein n=1 Tax=Chlamydomonas eustigma TaxID=1157962 RepID=A0A250X8W9_9CHLO|nr:hypothetical protein CEUSTIGMA_g6948.t1 [Chlamydomonas eustigma]|eukprot:GAX79507.1 hypothetical protein CEUSTIGMA_g6948.t1 [Chlamydomonas eustigma]